jgi:hypothetical protein
MGRPALPLVRRALLAGLALGAAATAGSGSAGAAEPVCRRWKLEVVCEVSPTRVSIGEEFSATVTARNAGDVALKDVTIQLRADAGAPCVAGAGSAVKTLVPTLEPGETKRATARFLPESVGQARVLGTARDLLGWAAGNCVCEVEIVGYPGLSASISTKDAKGEARTEYRPGERFTYVVEVKNDPAQPLPPDLKVELALPKEIEAVAIRSTAASAKGTAAGRRAASGPFRLTGERSTAQFEFDVRALTASPGLKLKARAFVSTSSGVLLAGPVETTAIEAPPEPETAPPKDPAPPR